jgi:DNA-binding transcriptional regulator/RsmH inhibitor MraZ
MFTAYKQTSSFKDGAKMEIMLRRKELEQHLDKMWQIYISGNLRQAAEYKKQVQSIKDAGLVVQRSKSTGKHRIVTAEGE